MIGDTTASRDSMTGLFKWTEVPRLIVEQIEKCRNSPEPVSLILIDIDHLKNILDYHGLPAGDYVITELGSLIVSNVPHSSSVARSGGQEFTVILPRTSLESAAQIAENVRKITEGYAFQFRYDHQRDFRQLSVTISAGVTSVDTPASAATSTFIYQITAAAYKALHRAKTQGYNRVCL